MLKIFYAGEDVDKTKYIFEQMKGKALLLTPEQSTFAAEKDVLQYTGSAGMMDIEVMSLSRLGFRVLEELGGGRIPRIGKYGRHMLLTKLIADAEKGGRLSLYKDRSGQTAFVELLSDMISELKQYGISPAHLAAVADEQNGLLQKKLSDICELYSAYEESIAGRFADNGDYFDLFLPKVQDAKFIKDKEIWLYGFDYLVPKNIELICRLMSITDVNIVFTCDYDRRDEHIFAVTQRMIKILRARAAESGVGCRVQNIAGSPRAVPAEIAAIEKGLFFMPEAVQAASDVVTLVRASNYYTEAETAAAYILSLVRDKGLKLSEIFVICNDTETRGSVIKRIFAEYGLELFIDRKRNLLGNPVAAYVNALIRSMTGMRTEDVIALLKTGLCREVTPDETEKLENYIIKYKIRGNRLNEPFQYGKAEYGEERFAELENIRKRVSGLFTRFANEFKKSRVTADRLSALYFFLRDDARLPEMIEAYAKEKEEIGLLEAGLETMQIWNELVAAIEEMNALLGEEKLSLEMIAKIIETGLAAVEVSLIPPAADGLMLGNMQRTPAGNPKALVVLGANDGVLPANQTQAGLLNEDERMLLLDAGEEICKSDVFRIQTEQLRIYKNFSSPEQYLYVSCTGSDLEGKPENPARIFKDLCILFPNIAVRSDIVTRGDARDLLQSRQSGLRHLAERRIENITFWKNAAAWYMKNDPDSLNIVRRGLAYSGAGASLKRETTEKMYGSETTVSPTGLERYGRCPFAHFTAYGLKPEERRLFELAGRESGELYHECLMEFSIVLNDENSAVRWDNVTQEQIEEIIENLLVARAKEYREGILERSEQERYKARRLKDALILSAEALVHQVRQGKIKKMYFEIPFGRRAQIPPVRIETAAGIVFVEGKIDRIDILEGDTVKIIDYKSGSETFNVKEVESGYRIQLLLYLEAALGMDAHLEPAGIFYFHIKDINLQSDGISEKAMGKSFEDSLRKQFAMSGIITDNRDSVIRTAGEFSSWSNIVSGLRRVSNEEGPGYSGSAFMDTETFEAFIETCNASLTQLAGNLLSGVIDVSPQRFGNRTSCDYCEYRSICGFDVTLPGCSYRNRTK